MPDTIIQKKDNMEKIKEDAIAFCQLPFGTKLVTNNQDITFSWETFAEDTAQLAKMIIPFHQNYGKYKAKTVEKIAYQTAYEECQRLMEEIKILGPLPVRVWYDQSLKLNNIAKTCTYVFYSEWEFAYFKKHGSRLSYDIFSESLNIDEIKEDAVALAYELVAKHFPDNETVKRDIINHVSAFYDFQKEKLENCKNLGGIINFLFQ